VIPGDQEALKFKEKEHVLIEKAEQVFKYMLYANIMCCRVREEISLRAVSDPM
jgi:hypothetical protein